MKQKTVFIKQGSSFRTTNEENLQVTPELPVGHYTILVDNRGFYIEPVPEITYEGKIYGEAISRAGRIINTFHDRKNNTGVLLEGEKGSGKTLLGRILAAELLKQGISTIVINQALAGEEFNSLIAGIDQPLMIMFDEFEKTYPSDVQQKLLTLLDGTYSKKKLFVVTCNDGYRVVEFMKNRPGRMYYKFSYKGLSEAFIREYAKDNLKNKDRIESVVSAGAAFDSFNFDMLKAIVEEMNRYNETTQEVLNYLNATPLDQRSRFKVLSVEILDLPDNIQVFDDHVSDGGAVNPFTDPMYIWGREKPPENKPAEAAKTKVIRKLTREFMDDYYIEFSARNIKEVKSGKFLIETPQVRITMQKDVKSEPEYTYRNFL